MLETLARPEAIWFDISVYAAGLAETVRRHGGDLTREKWLSGEASADQWSLGLPVKADGSTSPPPPVRVADVDVGDAAIGCVDQDASEGHRK